MLYLVAALVIIIAYLIGSVSSSVIISKKISGSDIREEGSGNAGATNMLRVHGKAAGAATLLCDAAKGVFAVLIGLVADKILLSQSGAALDWFESNILLGNLRYIAGVFAVLGHDFPIFFGFRGGKGVATTLGVMRILNWQIGLIVAVMALLILIISRYVSLGSIIGGVLYPAAVLAFMLGKNEVNWVYFACAAMLGVIAILKHHANIKRLIDGTENRLFAKKNKK